MPRYDDIYISTQNLRMNFPIFDLPPLSTCPGSSPLCRLYCYALKSERLYPNTSRSRQLNYQASIKPSFTARMIKYINKLRPPYFRLHSSGDFYSQNYLNKWINIWNYCKQTKFLAYTQNHDLNFTRVPSNVTLYHSNWPDSAPRIFPKDTLMAYVIDSTGKKFSSSTILSNIFKCPKTHTKGKCNDCMHCFDGCGDVVFELH